MATYYVSNIGNDASAGTSPATSWLTIAKALGAAGIASGDTLWIAPGVYREVVTVNMTSATVETFINGDVTGANFGVAGGEVQWNGYITNDAATPSATTLLNMNGKDFLTFNDILFIGGNAIMITSTVATATNINFTKCSFIPGNIGSLGIITVTPAANVALNWIIDSCTFIKNSTTCLQFTLTRPATADFDVVVVIKNCLFIGGGATSINITATGGNAFKANGFNISNCTYIGNTTFVATATNNSTTIPCNVYNCFVFSGALALGAAISGQIVEDYNILIAGASPRSNVTAGSHSISDGSYAPLFFTGHEYYSVGANLKPFGMPKPGSPLLGFGNQASSPTTDILAAARPSGFVKLATGTATAGAAKTITDGGAAFGTNVFAGCTIKIISGTGSGQTKSIASNTATVITVDGNWKTNPSTDSVFEVYLRATSSSGTATAGTTTTLTDSNAAWGVNMWAGYTLSIDGGTGSPQTLLVVSNTATVLTFATATAPDATSTYKLFRGTDENTINAGVGCYEYGQSAVKETTTVRTGSNAIRIPGAGYYDFFIPVAAASTTVTVYVQYDAAYSGTLPSMNIINGTECGVANATDTAVGAAGSWEELSLNFTPTAVGVITVRVLSSSTTPTSNAFFDDFNVV